MSTVLTEQIVEELQLPSTPPLFDSTPIGMSIGRVKSRHSGFGFISVKLFSGLVVFRSFGFQVYLGRAVFGSGRVQGIRVSGSFGPSCFQVRQGLSLGHSSSVFSPGQVSSGPCLGFFRLKYEFILIHVQVFSVPSSGIFNILVKFLFVVSILFFHYKYNTTYFILIYTTMIH